MSVLSVGKLDKITEQDKVADRRDEIVEAAEILIKYEGYIGRERIIADKLARLESIKIKGSSTIIPSSLFLPKPARSW